MTRAGDIIQALNARAGNRVPRERHTGLPYGWALWVKARAAAGVPLALRAGDLLALLAARSPRAPERGEELGRWQALLSLSRQGWEPPPPEERPLRGMSWAGSLLLHVLFALLLAWVAYLQSLLPPPPEASEGGGGRVGIGFVSRQDADEGEGVPGGEAAAVPGAPAAVAAPAATPAQAARSAAPVEAAASVGAVEVPVPLPEPDQPAPALPELQVREVPTPIEPDALPTVTPPPLPVPIREVQPRSAELQVREREVPVVQAPAIVAPVPREVDLPLPVVPEPELRPREITVVEAPAVQAPPVPTPELPEVAMRLPELRQREVAEPLPRIERAPAAVAVPSVQPRQTAAPALRQREVPMPAGAQAAAPASAPAPATASAPASAPAAAASAPSASPAEATASRQAPAADSGRAPAAPPGSQAGPAAPGSVPAGDGRPAGSTPGEDPWARALADDRWGPPGDAGARGPGLFDGDGRARLPGSGPGEGPGQGPASGTGDGVADRGAPGGGNDAWTRDRIAQSGTWLKRPPYDYEPTSFDRYWVPNQSLLAEWVRKGIQSVAIPIPGSNGKKLNCVVSLLQLGGGCGISDDNLNEQPAVARPPPDVPFKPELQEDNGSVGR